MVGARPRALALLTTGLLLCLAYTMWLPSPLPSGVKADRVVVRKRERWLRLMQGEVVLKSYRVALGWDPAGHKQREGDGKTPEGHYVLDWRNPESRFHLSLHLSYPDAADVEHAQAAGALPGGDIMIHGFRNGTSWVGRLYHWRDWTNGCIAVTDAEMDEIWRAVDDGTPIDIAP
jgi:murein L,D-transpeptidase YafK